MVGVVLSYTHKKKVTQRTIGRKGKECSGGSECGDLSDVDARGKFRMFAPPPTGRMEICITAPLV